MLYPIKIADIDLSQPIQNVENLEGYIAFKGLVRVRERILGYIQLPITNDSVAAEAITYAVMEQHSWGFIETFLRNRLAAGDKENTFNFHNLFDDRTDLVAQAYPFVTVAVCTRDRAADLALCLQGLAAVDYPHFEVLVVDNAPTNDDTRQLLEQEFPQFRYVCEPRPGLDWARNRAIFEAKGDIIAYTDDDVVVDQYWVKSLARVFADNDDVMAVTGLVVPYELETESQVLFETYGGFGRGFERKWYRPTNQRLPYQWLGAGQFGTGANMAYRRSVFEEIGYFDPALDVGTVTNGGGDLEMFFRVLKEGHTLVYEPDAMVRHRHRRDYAKLRSQIANNGIGLFSYFSRASSYYPDEKGSFYKLSIWWLWWWNLRRLLFSYLHPFRFPKDLIIAEFLGCFQSLGRYWQAHKNAQKIAKDFPAEPQFLASRKRATTPDNQPRKVGTAIRNIDLSQPLEPLTDVVTYSDVQIFATWQGQSLGNIYIANSYQPISVSRLTEVLTAAFGLKILELVYQFNSEEVWTNLLSTMKAKITSSHGRKAQQLTLPVDVSVSVVLATYDRPDDLRKCLESLVSQKSKREIEIIVVDNNPKSELTPPVVAEFPTVKLVNQIRQGLAYARNAGISASKGDIVIATDDDVTMPPTWLETLVAPFSRPDVAVVTGNVLPVELETQAQHLFESYGGLGRGFTAYEVGGDWFEENPLRTVPTWNLGATANAAFKKSIFADPKIGLMYEALGPGTPAGGCGEDTYVFYKSLKAGYTLVYTPDAYVWHRHRRTMQALKRQIFHYSKGHVAYHLTTLIKDKDLRVLARLFVGLPLAHLSRIYYRMRGLSTYPISFILLEIRGNLMAPLGLVLSHWRTKRIGTTQPLSLTSREPGELDHLTAEKPLSDLVSQKALVTSLNQE
ncbi:glycosyl transferase family 2 [Leptolyngbya sp. Heron Island J]|uniref:glycosyltransferase family 2 protein n=1 Tax=Leptolyngbya sp. Heron Island J TaxID=1385935 RepID=UPI0003B9EEC0|nr:glycosyltransferase [Leptolyngbya sp. Heron Island J]ESA32850.1 glycosyl transferase family 2 [Leptolyngbya sp. Heron Island J]